MRHLVIWPVVLLVFLSWHWLAPRCSETERCSLRSAPRALLSGRAQVALAAVSDSKEEEGGAKVKSIDAHGMPSAVDDMGGTGGTAAPGRVAADSAAQHAVNAQQAESGIHAADASQAEPTAANSATHGTAQRAELQLPAYLRILDKSNVSAIAALLARPAGVHGRLQKTGMPAVFSRSGLRYFRYRVSLIKGEDSLWDEKIQAWVDTAASYDTSIGVSQAANDQATVAKLRSPAPSCFYYVDHKYKVIYARSTKTAGSAVSLMFGFIQNAHECRTSLEECMKPCMGKAMCLNRTLERQELERVWPEYTVFGVARNPYARAVSSWAFVNVKFLANTSCVAPFQRFAALPSAYPYPCMNEPNAQWLIALNHIEPQGECLFTADGRPAVDFLARTESLDEDLQDLVQLINERRPPGVPEHPVPKIDLVNVNRQAAELGTVEQRSMKYAEHYVGGTALEDVQAYFQDDLRLFQIE